MIRVIFLRLIHTLIPFVNEHVGVVVDLIGSVLRSVQVVVNVGLPGLLVAAVTVHEDVLASFRRDWKASFSVFASQHYFKGAEAFVLFFSAERGGRVDVDLGKLILDHNGIATDYPVIGVPDVDPARHMGLVAVSPIHINGLVALFGLESLGP